MLTVFGIPLFSLLLLALYVQDKNAFPPPLSRAEENDCLRRMQDGDESARQTLIGHNLRLVAHVAKKYGGNPAQTDELISIGTIGLIKAANSYRLDKEFRFSTYAAKCVANEILMHFRAAKNAGTELSLYDPVETEKDNGSVTILDTLAAPDDISGEAELHADCEKLYRAIGRLDARGREVITLRYGLNGQPPLTQKEVAVRLGISRSYVSRLEKAALSFLREALR